ncbi:alanyl (membrane) aminopeptidase-like b [Cololabis saira]|uniref:alanyl (membrane) aminopeptidase-like b n=1 Tax=Cololabis saira TaxID=129043 RepID=UPI002AD54F9E|nr:alanyl (membrane) aminopeptidase-like b [Cololabis saira]
MAMTSATSKVLASCFAVLAVSVIAGTITMGVVYHFEMLEINPTRRPDTSSTVPPIPTLRLPKTLVPDTYTLVLQPHLYTRIVEEVNVTTPNQTLLFTGNSTVSFQCVKETRAIYLHSKDLKIHSRRVYNNTKEDTEEDIRISSWKVHEDESDFLEIQLSEPLKAGGNYSLFLEFSGAISDTLEALFVSTYVEQDTNEERFLAATQLEPTYARRLFPCFDEPDMKAVFDLTVIHRLNTEALSNTKGQVTTIDDEWQETTFLPTPKMSTYLLAFVVSQVDELTHVPQPEHRVDIRTYARREAIEAGHTKYADDITKDILTFYEEYFGIDYKLNKLYQVALPDLSVSAMENWGLITYQEGILLYEEGVSSWMHQEDMAVVIAHELAHQWFGNLVTMKWWSDIWLNEGFATYMSYLAVDNVNTSFQTRHTAIMDDLHAAFESDALISSHPLSMPPEEVQTTSQIIGTFDHISYAKGALVLRMLADVVTEDVFKKGIRNYLETFQGGNTDTDDLWDSIQEVRRDSYITDTRALMKPWTEQTGYPVITINTTDGNVFQNHFLYNVSAQSSNLWNVPIKVMSNKSYSDRLVWLDVKGPVGKPHFISRDGEWILANVNCTGYYRVNYNPENWQRLLHQLETNPNRIPLMNRGQLIDDAFNLARAKLVNVTLALNSTRFLKKERDLLPWQSAVRNLDYFIQMFERSEVYGPMQVYLREQVKNLYGFFRNLTDSSEVPDDHDHLLKHLQITAVEVACSNGLPECIKMAEEKFADWMNSNSSTNNIHPNLRSVIYCQAVAAGGKKEWEFAWEKYQNTTDTSEKDQLRQALSCTKKTWLLNRYLGYTLDPEKIRLMDVAATVIYVAENAAGQALAWNFIRANWDYVSQGDGAVLIGEVSSKFNTQFELEQLERFVEDYKLDEAHRALQSIEQTRVNIQWVEENQDVVLKWFERETAHLE